MSYYTEAKDLERAAVYLNLADQYKMTGYATYENIYHKTKYVYFLQAEKYDEALVEINQMLELYREVSPGSFGLMTFQKAYLLEQMGRIDDALSLYERAFYVIDSVQVVTLNKQTELLKKDYDTDQLMLKKEKIQGNIRSLFLCLVIIIILILLCFVIHAHWIRRGLQKSEEEMRRMAEEMEQVNIAKDVFLSTISTSISAPLNSVVDGSLKLASNNVVLDADERKLISEELNKTSAELLELINNILNLSRLEAGMMKFKPILIEIIPFVEDMIVLMQSKGKVVELSLPKIDKELKAYVDITYLMDIFNNISRGGEVFKVMIRVLEDDTVLRIDFLGADLVFEESSQEMTMANEVNRLLMDYFEGQYILQKADGVSPAMVCLKFPLQCD